MRRSQPLAYLFWHWHRDDADRAEYERSLAAFHTALAVELATILLSSYSFKVSRLPWMGSDGYEDWYVVDGFTALGALNEGAVKGTARRFHDRVAAASQDGAGAIYRLLHGSHERRHRRAFWMAKPDGTTYGDFQAAVVRWLAGCDGTLWQRQMVLGPAPEFVVRTDAAPTRRPPFSVLSVDTLALSGG